MSSGGTQHQTFSCPGCGRQILWNSRIAGTRVNCSCGQKLVVPVEAPPRPTPREETTYDLTDEPLLEELPSRGPGPGLQPPARTLGYESVESRSGVTIGDLIRHPQAKSLAITAAVIALGIGFRFCVPLFFSSGGGAKAGTGALLIVLALFFNVATMLVGVWVVAKLTGADLGSVPLTILRLCAVAVFGSVLFAVISSFDRSGGVQGMVIAWHAILLFNWVLFSMLFEFDTQEALFAVALVGAMQAVGACALFHR